MGRHFMSSAISLSVTDTGDFLQIRNAANTVVEVHEIRAFQTSDVLIAPNGIEIRRGVGGAGGVAHTEWEYDTTDTNAVVVAVDQATTDVGTVDLELVFGWNALQEFVWLATPQQRIWMAESDHLGVALSNADTLTMGWFIHWEEWGV